MMTVYCIQHATIVRLFVAIYMYTDVADAAAATSVVTM